MTREDFTDRRRPHPNWQCHNRLPVVIWRNPITLNINWYIERSWDRLIKIEELIGKQIEEVSDEEISLYLLKYSTP